MKDLQDLFDSLAPQRFFTHTEETRAKISAAAKNRSEETQAKMQAASDARKGTTGYWAGKTKGPRSAETRAKISANTRHDAVSSALKSKAALIREQERRLGIRPKVTGQGRKPQAVVTPLGLFAHIRLATAAHGHKSCSSIKQKIQKYPEQYYYVKELP
tara:strand:- start:5547 stop:6023 length:477 start_codon:yes stop_codon:yes gene_type:complete